MDEGTVVKLAAVVVVVTAAYVNSEKTQTTFYCEIPSTHENTIQLHIMFIGSSRTSKFLKS